MTKFCDIELGGYFKYKNKTYLKTATNEHGLTNAQSVSLISRKNCYFPPSTTVIPVREPIIACEILHTVFVIFMMIGVPVALIAIPIVFAALRFIQ